MAGPFWEGGSRSGIGALTAVPAGTTNGTVIGTMPSAAIGVRFYLPASASITFTIATSAPGSAPSLTVTVTAGTDAITYDELLADQAMIYITATSGSPLFRWY